MGFGFLTSSNKFSHPLWAQKIQADPGHLMMMMIMIMRLMMTIIIIITSSSSSWEYSPIGGQDTGRHRAALFQKNPTTRFEASPRGGLIFSSIMMMMKRLMMPDKQ